MEFQDLTDFHLLLLLPLSFRDSELRRVLGLCPLRNEATMKQGPRKERTPDPGKLEDEIRWVFESWQSPRPQTKDRPPVTSRGRQASVSSLPEDAGLGSWRRGVMCSGLGGAKLSRVHITPTHHGLHQDDLVKKGQGPGQPVSSGKPVLSGWQVIAPREAAQSCTHTSVQETTHQQCGLSPS